jgi:phage tail tape-measure protein
MTELELRRRIENALWDQGAESVDYVLVQAGANSAVGHHRADETQPRKGEPVLIDIAARVEGYFADVTQQVFSVARRMTTKKRTRSSPRRRRKASGRRVWAPALAMSTARPPSAHGEVGCYEETSGVKHHCQFQSRAPGSV